MKHEVVWLVAIVILAFCKDEIDINALSEDLIFANLAKLQRVITKDVPMWFLDKVNTNDVEPSVDEKKSEYAEQARRMFFHAYNSYMMYAFPADELMPVTCTGRVRGLTPSRGEVDEALGRYMLTLVDSLDTLLVMKEYSSFEHATKMVIGGLSFDTDVTINLFEANIRVLGGLLSGHAGLLYLNTNLGKARWYSDELLKLAVDLADRLLPAFHTPTGLPVPRVNLRHGVYRIRDNETCTACAGTLFLEFATLSRYTGNNTYEDVARRALDYLYEKRTSYDLPGSVMDINRGKWTRRETTIGAGIDSYFEYLMKGYILTGEEQLWDMFETQYKAVKKHLMSGRFMLTINSASPEARVRDHQDSLQAFWPGVQVLAGDIEEAERVYEHYMAAARKNQYTLPEAFLYDGRMFWSQYYIRPELLESTYFLYKATKNPKYVEYGKEIMDAIESRCRVTCGYSALKSVLTGELENRLDSFVLSETFKYMFLLFADDSQIGVPIDDYVFTTEAHIIPLKYTHIAPTSSSSPNLSLHQCKNENITQFSWKEINFRKVYSYHPYPTSTEDDRPYYHRQTLVPREVKGSRKLTSKLQPHTFDHNDSTQLEMLSSMGISVDQSDGTKLQLVHNPARAYSEALGMEGVIFMKEIMEHTKSLEKSGLSNADFREVNVKSLLLGTQETLLAGKAMFGPQLTKHFSVVGNVEQGEPYHGCSPINRVESSRIVILERGACMFVEKVRHAEAAGAKGVIIIDNTHVTSGVLAMSGDGVNDVNIPSVFLNQEHGNKLLEMYNKDPKMIIAELRIGPPQENGKCES